jgi:hypothetical protein
VVAAEAAEGAAAEVGEEEEEVEVGEAEEVEVVEVAGAAVVARWRRRQTLSGSRSLSGCKRDWSRLASIDRPTG